MNEVQLIIFKHFYFYYSDVSNFFQLKSIVEGELLCLRVQMMAAPKEAVEEFVKEMVTDTLKWMAYRQDHGKNLARCDVYACAVIETLLTGQNKIKPDSRKQAEYV